MSNYRKILVSSESGIGIITINRPDVRNALDVETVSEMKQALLQFRVDESIGVVVITGAGEKSFAAGADINELRTRTFRSALEARMQSLYDQIEDYEKPTIAAVNGYALGGGCELAMACDIRIAQINAKFGLPELNLGIIPGAGGTQRLARLVGKGRALEMILTGRMIDASEAFQIGLVTRVVETKDVLDAAKQVAEAILAKGPVAVRLARLAIKAGLETDQHTGLLLERLVQAVLFTTNDKEEGVSAFLEKRKANFKGE